MLPSLPSRAWIARTRFSSRLRPLPTAAGNKPDLLTANQQGATSEEGVVPGKGPPLWFCQQSERCSCGSTMRTHTTKPHARPYHYYSCARRRELQTRCDCEQPSIQARKAEPLIWEFVSELLKDPKPSGAGSKG